MSLIKIPTDVTTDVDGPFVKKTIRGKTDSVEFEDCGMLGSVKVTPKALKAGVGVLRVAYAKKQGEEMARRMEGYTTTSLVTELVRRIMNGETRAEETRFIFKVFSVVAELWKEGGEK